MLDSTDIPTISKLAELGRPDMQFLLGCIYYKGEYGLKVDMTKARELFSRAAKSGNSDAQLRLGMMYITSEGGDSDIGKGLTLITQSAMNANQDALQLLHNIAETKEGNFTVLQSTVQCVLGHIYFYGIGVDVDRIEARRLLKKARSQGDADASFMLAIISYDEGDIETALAYVTEAAKKGHKDAIEALSIIKSGNNDSSSAGNVIKEMGNSLVRVAENRAAGAVLDAIISIFRNA